MPESQWPVSKKPAYAFQTTQWSLVSAAGAASTAASRQALGQLCESYWHPLYCYARRRGYSADEARDQTQGFFTTLIEKGYVRAADPQRGRFRSFLLTAFKHFLANEYDRERALKRGGGSTLVALDAEEAEQRFRGEPPDERTPERVYERRWALALLDLALGRLREEFAASEQEARFDGLKEFLTGDAAPYALAAERLGMTEGAVKVAVHRLRKRFRELVRAEIARLVEDPRDVDDEIRVLFSALG
jgi:RNA polymerase sigma factor (sigma-70 family)